jgi:hypothetical protein
MTDDSQVQLSYGELRAERESRIRRLILLFKEAWKSDERPEIEEYLDWVEEAERSLLLQELLAVEFEFVKLAGHSVSVDEYRQRFPEYVDVIERVGLQTTEDLDHSSSDIFDSAPGIDIDKVREAELAVAAEVDQALDGRSDGAARSKSKMRFPALEEFVAALVKNQILSADEIDQILPSFPADSTSEETLQLARRLVNAGKLTTFQISMILKGRTKQLCIDNYLLLDRIGHGGMGEVFKGRHFKLNQVVAIKFPSNKGRASSSLLKRFRQEIKVAARLQHSNIVRTFDAAITDRLQYLVMDHIEGTTLDAVVREQGPLPIEKALDFILQAAKGLAYAHDQGVVHRDIKPKNLMLENTGTVKLLDMGLARIVEIVECTDATRSGRLTQLGEVFGSYDYMSPEQALDAYGTDARADVYSLGCVLYFLLTGKSPFQRDSPFEVLKAHQEAYLPYARSERDDVSEQLDTVLHKMMAKHPNFRHQTMDEVIASMTKLLMTASS